MRSLLLRLPESGHVLGVTLAHSALVIVAQALLSPKRALTLQVDFVCAEERCLLQLVEYWRNLVIQVLKVLYRCATSVQVALCDLSSTLRRAK